MDKDNKLCLEWVQQPDGSRALVFDAKTWAIFEAVAKERSKDARHIISAAVAECLGPIMMDNFTLNRFLRKD